MTTLNRTARRGSQPCIASGVPEHYGLSPQLLGRWQRLGWLGRRAEGTGSRYDWWNPDVAAQIDWLKRLRTARHLDQEDADGGWRLRASGASYGFRPEGRPMGGRRGRSHHHQHRHSRSRRHVLAQRNY